MSHRHPDHSGLKADCGLDHQLELEPEHLSLNLVVQFPFSITCPLFPGADVGSRIPGCDTEFKNGLHVINCINWDHSPFGNIETICLESGWENTDEIDKLAEYIGEIAIKQEDQSCEHDSNELHMLTSMFLPVRHEVLNIDKCIPLLDSRAQSSCGLKAYTHRERIGSRKNCGWLRGLLRLDMTNYTGFQNS
ncbi:hypothetical protein Tco_0318767 [Tanacetum coccineum]